MKSETSLSTHREAFKRSACPLANTLDLLGDKWTLLIIRDLFLGKRRYRDFLEAPEAISTNVLAVRLQRLEQKGLVEKRAYQSNPVRWEYTLTAKGADLRPVLQEIVKWAYRHIPGVATFPRYEQEGDKR